MLERTDAITKEVLEPITFVLAQPTVIGTNFCFRRKKLGKSFTVRFPVGFMHAVKR